MSEAETKGEENKYEAVTGTEEEQEKEEREHENIKIKKMKMMSKILVKKKREKITKNRIGKSVQ